MASEAVTVVEGWQAAANRQDAAALTALSDPEIEIVGPRGSGYGHQLLRDWLARAGLTLETRRVFARDDVVVLEQHGVWRDAAAGATVGEADVGSVFRVRDGRVVQYARYDTVAEALNRAELTAADAVGDTGAAE